MYLQITNFVELCAIMNIVTLMPSSSHILVSSFLVFRHLGCMIFCTMFSVCKAGWKREINKLLCIFFGNFVSKTTKNEVTKMGWNAHKMPKPYSTISDLVKMEYGWSLWLKVSLTMSICIKKNLFLLKSLCERRSFLLLNLPSSAKSSSLR